MELKHIASHCGCIFWGGEVLVLGRRDLIGGAAVCSIALTNPLRLRAQDACSNWNVFIAEINLGRQNANYFAQTIAPDLAQRLENEIARLEGILPQAMASDGSLHGEFIKSLTHVIISIAMLSLSFSPMKGAVGVVVNLKISQGLILAEMVNSSSTSGKDLVVSQVDSIQELMQGMISHQKSAITTNAINTLAIANKLFGIIDTSIAVYEAIRSYRNWQDVASKLLELEQRIGDMKEAVRILRNAQQAFALREFCADAVETKLRSEMLCAPPLD